ncbi:unnamed protein product [Closterium sp. NIES-54]
MQTSRPFDGKYFFTWSFEFELMMEGAQILGFFDGSLPYPTNGTQYEKQQYTYQSMMAYTILLRNITPTQQQNIRSYRGYGNSAELAYNHLKSLYQATDSVSQIAVSLADPSGGPVIATSSTVLPCPAVPSGILSGLHLPSFSTNLVAGCALQDGGVHQFTPAYERVTHCTCARTGRHLATFTRQPGSDLYTLTTESPQVAASASVSASGQLSAPCSCRSLAHKTVLWHHRLGHPSVQRLRGMHSRYLVSGLPRVLPPLPPSLAPPCLPCVEGRQRAAPHSSSFPPTTAPLQMLHMDVWGPARVRRQGRERYFLIVVDDYSRYTTVFPLHTKGEVPDVLIPWISRARLQLRERFRSEFPVLCLHSDRGGEFSSDLLAAYCAEHGIRQSFTLPASPQQNGVAERRVGLVMEVARTSLVHAAAPHFLWPFAVRYAAHQLNLWPRVSALETSPTLLWTGEVGDASRFRVWGSRAFVRDTSADKLSSRTAPCVFLGFVPDASGWQFYHPASHRVFPSQDVTFDESVPFYRLFPYRTAPLPPPPLFLAPGAAVVDPLPPQGAAPFGVSQVDPVEPAEVAVDSRPARGAEPERAEPERAEPERAEPGGAESGGAETGGAEPGGTESGGTEPGVAESGGAKPGGVAVDCEAPGGPPSSQQLREWYSRYCSLRRRASRARGATGGGTRVSPPRREAPSSPQLREWYARHISLRSGAAGAGVPGVDAAAGAADPGAGGTAAAGGAAGGAASTEDPGVGAAAGAADPAAGGAASAAGGAAAAAGVENPEVGASAGAEDPAAGVSAGSGVAARPRPYFNPLLQQVLGQPPPPCPPLALECPPSVESQPQLPPASPLPVPATYTGPTGGLAERREPTSRPVSSSVACLCCYHWSSWDLQRDLTLTVSSTVTQYLGLNIREEEDAIYLSAEKYADTIAKRFVLTPTAISTPYRYTTRNDKGSSALLKPAGIRDYQKKLGCLLFAAVTCRPDLSYSASQLATYLKKPEAEHLAELDRALHYFVSTPTISLTYYKNATTPTELIGYVDADHSGDSNNRRSRTGYIYRLEPIGPISWQSSKQELIALSSAEAEYIALCSATKEGLYLRELLEEAKLARLPNFTLFCDNQSAIRIANKNGFANRTKHIALRYFFVKDEIEKGRLELSYCPTSEMAADYLTKKLGKQKFEYCMLLTGQSHVSDTPEAKGSVGNNRS